MTNVIALLRGINVGGKRILPMKALVSILERLGCTEVRTYIQSGNAVFITDEDDLESLASSIRTAIGERFGFEPGVMCMGAEDLEKAIDENPFPEAETEPNRLHVGFFASVPEKPDLEQIESLRTDSERFRLVANRFYLHAPDGIGRSRLAARAERLLGVGMTLRNWRTVSRIRDMASNRG